MEQKKSRMLRLTLMGGQARVFICDTTEMAQQARDIHNASNTCSAAMGRMLAATAIMGANLKSEGDRITATINGGGPAGPICAIAGPDGTVKVTIEHPEVELPLKENGKLNVGGALGKDGQLTVMRSFGFGEPYVGRVALVSGEIAEDFAMYYLESEQTPSLCALGTLVGERIISSGGILIQAMPDCSEELLDALEIRAELFSSISQLLSEMTLEEIVEGCFRGLNPEILEEMPLHLLRLLDPLAKTETDRAHHRRQTEEKQTEHKQHRLGILKNKLQIDIYGGRAKLRPEQVVIFR